MQGPQAGARVRVHRVGEPPPCLLLHGEGVRRAAGPAQGEHQQFGEAFARWVGRDEPDEFVDVLEGTAAYAGVLVVVTAVAGAVFFLPAALAAGGTGWSVPPRPPPASGSAPRSLQGGARPHRRHPARGRRGHPAQRPADHGRGRILALSFLSYATGGVVFLKGPGIGTALTILVDAPLIRVVLLPVTMRLAGRRGGCAGCGSGNARPPGGRRTPRGVRVITAPG